MRADRQTDIIQYNMDLFGWLHMSQGESKIAASKFRRGWMFPCPLCAKKRTSYCTWCIHWFRLVRASRSSSDPLRTLLQRSGAGNELRSRVQRVLFNPALSGCYRYSIIMKCGLPVYLIFIGLEARLPPNIGALWVPFLGWPCQILGAIRAAATAWEAGEILFFFGPLNNARFHRFSVG